MSALSLWGGHECTVNRVGDRRLDQTERGGHEHRLGDLGAASADLLAIEIDTIFTADDEGSVPVRMLDALDAGEAPPRARQGMHGAYRPAVIDGVLDLLLDGARAARCFRSAGSMPDMSQMLQIVDGYCDDEMAVASRQGSYLPSMETMLERFVLDRRRLRTQSIPEEQAWLAEHYLAAAE